MKDSKNVMDLKNNAMATGLQGSPASAKEGGFKFFHLLLLAVLGIMLGAYVQLHVFKA